MNMGDPIRRYNIITLRPHWAQYIISQGMSFIISCALFLVAGHDSITYKMPFVVLGGVIVCYTLPLLKAARYAQGHRPCIFLCSTGPRWPAIYDRQTAFIS